MGVTWEEADADLIGLAQRIIRESHEHLLDAKIGFMYRSEAAKSGNKWILGKARKVSEEQRVFIDFDFVIWIAKKEFARMSDDQKAAVVDHELCHCGGSYGEWTIRKHDFEEFMSIVVRHGLWLPDLAFAAKAFENAGKGQQALFYPEERGEVRSVATVELKHFSGTLSAEDAQKVREAASGLLQQAAEDPDAVMARLTLEAQELKAENGGEITVDLLHRKLRCGYAKAAKIKELLDQVGA